MKRCGTSAVRLGGCTLRSTAQRATPLRSKSRTPSFGYVVDLGARWLRDFCVTRWCFVMLWGRICNGHPASVVVKNQLLALTRISNFSIPSSFEPGGREFESLRARHRFANTRMRTGMCRSVL